MLRGPHFRRSSRGSYYGRGECGRGRYIPDCEDLVAGSGLAFDAGPTDWGAVTESNAVFSYSPAAGHWDRSSALSRLHSTRCQHFRGSPPRAQPPSALPCACRMSLCPWFFYIAYDLGMTFCGTTEPEKSLAVYEARRSIPDEGGPA
jgi:hypothetical protein